MRYPNMAASRTRRIRVPRLDGGLNLEDIPTSVADNQLTDCCNLWWHDGALRTRPGVDKLHNIFGDFNIVQPVNEGETLFIHYQPDGEGHRRFYAVLQRADGIVESFGLSSDNCLTLSHDDSLPCTAFGCHAPQGLDYDFLFYLSSGEILTYHSDTCEMTVASPYVPHVYYDCPPTVHLEESGTDEYLLEHPNILSDQCVCTYTTDGKGTYFYLPDDFRGAYITAKLTIEDPTTGRIHVTSLSPVISFAPVVFGLDPALYTEVKIDYEYNPVHSFFRAYGIATRIDGDTEIVPIPYMRRNNIRLEMRGYCHYDPLKICLMGMAAWYGGNYGSVNDGTRLFVAGYSGAPNRLMWSHVNNPLYFPQPNCAYIGDRHTAITALVRRSDQLIIFKEHSIYAADYVSHSDPVSAVVDERSNETSVWRASFPITPLHRTVGCTYPRTIQLVNNKLIWMTDAGQLYMLVAGNRHSDRNVRAITSMITRALTAHDESARRGADAGEYDGRYLLTVANTMYVLDCRHTAFNGFEKYVNEHTALQSLVFYRWKLPTSTSCHLISGGQSLLLAEVKTNVIVVSHLQGDTDYGETIPTSFTTKMFGCADPTRRMSISSVCLGLSDTRQRVRVTYHTDHGDYTNAAVLAANRVNPDPRRITTRRLAPHIRRAMWFGITCESEDAFAVTNLDIDTRIDAAI